MNEQIEGQNHETYISRAVEVAIRLGILALLLGWCFQILSPFISPFIWGLIIAVTEYPLFKSMKKAFGGRTKIAAITLTIGLLAVLLIPTILLADSLIEGIRHVREIYESGQLTIPPPGENTKSWPIFAKPVIDAWQLASENLGALSAKYADEIKKVGLFVLNLIAGTGFGVLQFILSIIIAGVFVSYAEEGGSAIHNVFVRLDKRQGAEFAALSELTIRNVVKGILGVAVAQTFLAGLGFVVIGIPAAGFWIFMCLVLAIIQVGVGPIVIGSAIYVFATHDTLPAILFAIWTVFVSLSDNILKPILLGRGAPVPMVVVFLGSIGGFIYQGFIGLFLGAVILSLGYKLFQRWTKPSDEMVQPVATDLQTKTPEPAPKS